MGAKLSCKHRGSGPHQLHGPTSPAPARVIAADGSLKEFRSVPGVSVSHVLGGDASNFFVCNSDELYFGQPPPALDSGALLRPGQIYFVLPAAMLGRPLSTADMAALAVRASSALAAKRPRSQSGRRGGGKKIMKARVMPVHEERADGEDVLFNEKLNERTLGEFTVPLRPAKSDQKLATAAALMRSRLKRALSIIQEDAE